MPGDRSGPRAIGGKGPRRVGHDICAPASWHLDDHDCDVDFVRLDQRERSRQIRYLPAVLVCRVDSPFLDICSDQPWSCFEPQISARDKERRRSLQDRFCLISDSKHVPKLGWLLVRTRQ